MSEGVLRIKKLHFEWVIERFSGRKEATGKSVESPFFTSNGSDQLKLKLYPNGDKEKVKDNVSLFLYAASCSKWTGLFEFSILGASGRKSNCETFERLIPTVGYGFPEFISRQELFNQCSELLPNDTLTICCEVKNVSRCPTDSKQCQLQVAHDLEHLMDRHPLSDVTFTVSGQQFQAHKAILSARSPVFAALFQSPELNDSKATNLVDVTDMEADVFEQLLRFIYTGRVNQLELTAFPLLAAASKYDIKDLKALCEEEMSRTLSIDNAARTLIHADLHSAKRLRQRAIIFINQNSSDVVETEGWKAMVESHSKLIAEIYVKLVKK